MTKIYELEKQQESILDMLYYLDEDVDAEEVALFLGELEKVKGKAIDTLKYLSSILLQNRYDLQYADDEVSRLDELKKTAQKRVKKYETVDSRLNQVMVRICNKFNVKSFNTDYHDFKKYVSPGAVVVTDSFDIDKIPGEFVTVMPESKKINTAKVAEFFIKQIKSDSGRLVDSITVVSDDALPGLSLVRKESIK
ncbi:MAG: siphovirus Gp157 family protein [Patescibacteria group bacterium]